ncbi:MAG TPA: long-chain fatty acid--CoA ligase [Propionibacterium sp.]|nr:long-chain fatty acid--CoA ligase [Propionibacterium sp.]
MTGPGNHTLGRWVSERARLTPDKVALDDRGVCLPYATLALRIERFTAALRTAGHRPGDRVATLTGNSADHVALLFACAELGLALVPLSWRLTPHELAAQLTVADPVLTISEPEHGRTLASALDRLPDPPPHVDFADLDAPLPRRDHRSPAQPERAASDDDALLVLFTSGSTGTPKAAVLTQANCHWTNLVFGRTVPLTADDVVLSVLPQFHAGGWNIQLLLGLWMGATVVLERAFDPRRALHLIEQRRVTTMMGVPTHYLMMAEQRRFAAADLSSLRTIVVGGAPMPLPLLRTWHARGVRLTQGYGLTEAGPNVLCLPAELAFTRAGSAGVPYPHVECAVADPDTGEELDGAATGELLVRGPSVFAGYLGDAEATARSLRGGWLHTGDLVHRDAEGFFQVLDRIDDLYITSGENVSPVEVEQALLAHPAVAQAGVVGVPDERRGEVGLAFVVRRPGVAVDEVALIEHCRERLARFKVPAEVRFAEQLPQASLEKVRRAALRARVES